MTMCDSDGRLSYLAAAAIGGTVRSSTLLIGFGPKLISQFCLSGRELKCLKNVSVDEVIKNFFDTEDTDWLFVVTYIVFLKGAAVTITEDTLVVYDKGEPSELPISNSKLHLKLIGALVDKAKELHVSFKIPSNVHNKF